MDSLKTLFDSKKYELILKITEGSHNPNDLIYRISSLMCLGKYNDALEVIDTHQEILNNNIAAILPIHIQLLCTLERYDDAVDVLDYYSNLPYQSQVVEELLKKMPEYIASQRKQSAGRYYTEEEIADKLTSNKNEEVLFGLDLVKKRDVFTFLKEISNILTSYPNQTVRSLALMLLVEKEVDRQLNFLSEGEMINVNPKHLSHPFSDDIFTSFIKRFYSDFKDPILENSATHILSSYVIYTYPREIKEDVAELYFAIYIATKNMYSLFNETKEKICEKNNLNIDKLNFYINKIDVVLGDI